MKKDYNKTLRVLHLIRKLIDSPNNMVNDATFREIMCAHKKACYHKLINELTEDHAEHLALLKRETIKITDFDLKGKVPDSDFDKKETYNYYLNESYKGISGASAQTEFMLECYSRLGSILPDGMQNRLSKVINQKTKKAKNLKKKFCHVKPIAGKELEPNQKKFLPLIIKSILLQKELLITYTNALGVTGPFVFRPLTLSMYRDDLYLLGTYLVDKVYEEKNCKIRRISEVTQLEASFPYPTGWDPQGKFQGSSGIINNRDESCNVQIKIYGVSRLAFKEKNIFNNKLLNENNGDDFDLYEVTCTRYNEFLGQLFVYAQDIEIVDNEHIKKLFIEKAMAAIGRNQKLKQVA
jgi:hypothetical protein